MASVRAVRLVALAAIAASLSPLHGAAVDGKVRALLVLGRAGPASRLLQSWLPARDHFTSSRSG
jgi:hypothetical protein